MKTLTQTGIDGVYVVHAKKGYSYHENRINELFHRMDMSFEYVTDGDPSELNETILKQYFTKNIALPTGVLSCTLNHLLTYKKIVQRKQAYAIVFENDPFFLSDFIADMEKIMAEVRARKLNGFIISLENTSLKSPSYFQTRKNQLLYPAKVGRAAGAYLIDFTAAEAISKDLELIQCNTVIDWWHNDLINRNIIQLYWAHPAIVEQGSHNGYLNGTISTQQKSARRRVAWLLQKYYKYYFRRLFKEKNIIS